MKPHLPPGTIGFLLFVCCAKAFGADVTILCSLDDEHSLTFCRTSAAAASVCQKSFAINDAKREIRELNPGRILPAFKVSSWSETAIDVVRTVEAPKDDVQQVIQMSINRLTGRLIESSSYVRGSTGEVLSPQALEIYAAERARTFGLWGLVDRRTITGVCKATERAF